MLYSDTLQSLIKLISLNKSFPSPSYSSLSTHSIANGVAELLLKSKLLPSKNCRAKVQGYINSQYDNAEDEISVGELIDSLLLEEVNENIEMLPRDIYRDGESELEKRLFPITKKIKTWINEDENVPKFVLLKSELESSLSENKFLSDAYKDSNDFLFDFTDELVKFKVHFTNELLGDDEGIIFGYLWKSLSKEKDGFTTFIDFFIHLRVDIWKVIFIDKASENEFIENTLLYFESKSKSCDLSWNKARDQVYLKRDGICNGTIQLDVLLKDENVNITSIQDAFIWFKNQHMHPDYHSIDFQLINYLLNQDDNYNILSRFIESANQSSCLTINFINSGNFYQNKLLRFLFSNKNFIPLALHIMASYKMVDIPWRNEQEVKSLETVLWNLSTAHLTESIFHCPEQEKIVVFYNSLMAVSIASVSSFGLQNVTANEKLVSLVSTLELPLIQNIQNYALELSVESYEDNFHAYFHLLFLLLKVQKNHQLEERIAAIYVQRLNLQISHLTDKGNEKRNSFSNLRFSPKELYDEYPWYLLNSSISNLISHEILKVIKSSYSSILFNKNDYHLKEIIGTHLIILLKSQENKDFKVKIFNEFIEFIREFSFDEFDLFDYGSSKSLINESNKVSINLKFSSILDQFSDEQFNSFIQLLNRKDPTTFQLLLYANALSKEDRVAEIVKLILLRDDTKLKDASWTDEIKESVNLAHAIGLSDVRNILKEDGKESSHKSFKNDWDSIGFQYKLINVLDENLSVDEKIDKIRTIENPLKNNNSHPLSRSNEAYINYIKALVYFESDANKSCLILKRLCNSHRQELYITALFDARIIAYEKSEHYVASLEESIAEWSSLSGKSCKTNLENCSEIEVALLLKAYSLSNNSSSFTQIWNDLSDQRQFSLKIAEIYINECMRSETSDVAEEYLIELIQYHNVEKSNSIELKGKISKLSNLIIHPELNVIKSELDGGVTVRNVIESLTDNWRDIRSLNHEEIARVMSSPTINENHFFHLINDTSFMVFQDLVSQRLYFQEIKTPKKSKNKSKLGLVAEDHISAFYLKIIKNKFSMFGWSVSDQNKLGESSSGEGMGEVDGLLRSHTGESIAVFEALILNCLNKKYLNDHLDKVSKYDTNASPVAIFAVYYEGKSFDRFKSKYVNHIKKYTSEKYKKASNHCIEKLKETDNLFCFTEKRLRGGTEVQFIHYVMNLLH
ncbi:hypothetical protein GCM10009111_23140 [Colwellia asteriadis]|uniref:Uncharacterized protein n=1 Tax=Colwellia asteriadis TaxID=517723 RepID=A0ABN1L8W5_9GAMM